MSVGEGTPLTADPNLTNPANPRQTASTLNNPPQSPPTKPGNPETMHALERLRSAVRKVFVLSLVDRRIYIDEPWYPRHRPGVESRPPR